MAKRNIAIAFPDLTQEQQNKLILSTVRDNIRVFAETPFVWTRSKSAVDQLCNHINDQPLLPLRENGQPFMVLAPHIGNWELLGYFLGQHYNNASMYLPSRQGERIDQFIKAARERFGNTLLPATSEGVKAFYKHAAEGNIVSILPDQSPSNESGMVYARFFQETAATIVLPARVAAKNKLDTFVGAAIFDETTKKYNITFTAVPGFGKQDCLADNVQLMNDAIENIVREYPSQYLWTYKRFKRRPKDDPLYDRFYD